MAQDQPAAPVEQPAEPLNQQVVVMLTKSEKLDLMLLKAHGLGSESAIMRSLGPSGIVQRAREIRERVGPVEPAEVA